MPYQEGDELHDLEEMVALNIQEYTAHWSPEIKIFPNPFSNDVYFDLSQIQYTKSLSLAIYDIQGKLVKKLENNTSGQSHWNGTNANSQQVPNGLYFLSILVDGKQHLSKPLVKS
jgi:flagellar hook assembly protein FlgD